MYFAGLSSATREVSIGVIEITDDGQSKVIIDYTVMGPQGKSENLIPLMKLVMDKAGLTPKDLSGLAVTVGPGSYSGLRGSVSSAKTLAQALKIPIYGVSTLETIAYNYLTSTGTILVILDAVRDESSVALFAGNGTEIKRLTEDFVISLDRLAEFKKDGMIVTTDIIPRGINVARIGANLLKNKVKTNFNKLVPKYSHMPKYLTAA